MVFLWMLVLSLQADQAIKGPRRFVLGNITLAFNPGTYIEVFSSITSATDVLLLIFTDTYKLSNMIVRTAFVFRYHRVFN